ncbi:MAG: hypothetical protein KF773_37455 [Deltaproteobacteria bacterium]|nr:hypothetical protein [Deltaproteobacteria bacterium]
MKLATWRNATLVLLVVCGVQRYRACTRKPAAAVAIHELRVTDDGGGLVQVADGAPRGRTATPMPGLPAASGVLAASAGGGKTLFGLRIPPWLLRFGPQPGETPRAYRDRMLPLAQAAIAPQRRRVAHMRDQLATLGEHQRAELDAAVQEAATAIQDRVMNAILSGDFDPSAMRPMTGVTMARELLSIVEKGNERFLSALSPQQRGDVGATRFDFADYLLFSTRWEDALKILDAK